MEREFNELDHTYSVDGKPYVGVNELLLATGLIKDLASFIPADRLESARVKGTMVHRIAELRLRGILDPCSVDDRLKRHLRQIQAFLSDFEVFPLHIEKELWDDQKLLAGRTDLIAQTNKGLAIIDWGTVNSNHYLQMHAYRMLAKSYLELEIICLIDVGLSGEGNYQVKTYLPDRKIELLILSALNIFNYKKGAF